MKTLYIGGSCHREGKTAVALTIARRYARQRTSVGYWKPFASAGPEDDDVTFAKSLLGLKEEVSALDPLSVRDVGEEWDSERVGATLAKALEKAAGGNELLIVEGIGLEGISALRMERAYARTKVLSLLPEARAILVARYRDGEIGKFISEAQETLGVALAGVVINAVPEPHQWFVAEQVCPQLEALGIVPLAVLPQDRALATWTIAELAARLDAKVLVGQGEPGMDELFENVMFGSMSAEDGRQYFDRKENKLVITRGDRPDVHLAALRTSTRCLLLAGGYPSYPFVLDAAAKQGVPVLSVPDDMEAVIARIDALLGQARANSVTKIRLFEDLMARHFNWEALNRALGQPWST